MSTTICTSTTSGAGSSTYNKAITRPNAPRARMAEKSHYPTKLRHRL
jgi:hypothetical protein